MASGSQRYLAYAKETVERTAPSGDYTALRNTGGSGIANERTSVTSNEIRSDRQIVVHRLGQNQPGLSIPYEFSWYTYDELIEGALASHWSAGQSLQETVTFGDTTAIITGDSSWIDKGIEVGNFFIIRDSVSNDGIYKVASIGGTDDVDLTMTLADGTTAVAFTAEATVSVNIETGYYGGDVNPATNTITVSATDHNISAASPVFDDVRIGDAIYFTGFTEAGNNGYKTVLGATGSVITVEEDLTDESLTTGLLEWASYSGFIQVGLDFPTFAVEEGFTDIEEYHYTAGAKVNSMSMSIQPDAMITGEFGLQGQIYKGLDSTQQAGTVTYPANTQVFDSYTGSLFFGGDLDCTITGFDFTLDNALARRFTLMQINACGIGEGRATITGTVNAFMPDAELSRKFNAEEEFHARIQIKDLDGNSYTLGFPRIKFTNDSRTIPENDVTVSLGFQALGSEDFNSMYVLRQPIKPVV